MRAANSPGPVCPQKLPDISNETRSLSTVTSGRLRQLKRLLPSLQNQSEDCLYLNIYAPVSGQFSPFPCHATPAAAAADAAAAAADASVKGSRSRRAFQHFSGERERCLFKY